MDSTRPPTQEPAQNQTEINAPKNKPNYFKTIIFLVFINTLFYSISYFYLKNQLQKKQFDKPQITPTVPPNVNYLFSEPIDETAGWKIYNDTKYNYSFEYPQLWSDKTDLNDKNLGNFTLESNEKEMIYGTVFTGPPDLENDKKNEGSSKSFIINKEKYLFVSYNECAGQGCNLSKKHLDVFDQILSTFKFIDDRSVCVPTYQVEINSEELTAKQNYSMRCTEQRSEKDCHSVDLYNQKADNFSVPDEIPDCIWKNTD